MLKHLPDNRYTRYEIWNQIP